MNWRQKTVPMHEKVDPENPLKKDGEFVPDNPKLTRMQNCLRYMRGYPMYMPPNPWPEAMLLFGIDHHSRLCCAFFMTIEQFEEIPERELFGLCQENTQTLYFIPALKLPPGNAAAQNEINSWLAKMKNDEFSLQVQYLETNGWWIRRPSDFTIGESGSRMS